MYVTRVYPGGALYQHWVEPESAEPEERPVLSVEKLRSLEAALREISQTGRPPAADGPLPAVALHSRGDVERSCLDARADGSAVRPGPACERAA